MSLDWPTLTPADAPRQQVRALYTPLLNGDPESRISFALVRPIRGRAIILLTHSRLYGEYPLERKWQCRMTEKHRTGQVPLTVRVFDDPRIATERITAGTMDRPGPPGAFKLPPRFPQ